MKCIKCGNELVENAQFCTNCGASQEQNTQPVNPVYEQDTLAETTQIPKSNKKKIIILSSIIAAAIVIICIIVAVAIIVSSGKSLWKKPFSDLDFNYGYCVTPEEFVEKANELLIDGDLSFYRFTYEDKSELNNTSVSAERYIYSVNLNSDIKLTPAYAGIDYYSDNTIRQIVVSVPYTELVDHDAALHQAACYVVQLLYAYNEFGENISNEKLNSVADGFYETFLSGVMRSAFSNSTSSIYKYNDFAITLSDSNDGEYLILEIEKIDIEKFQNENGITLISLTESDNINENKSEKANNKQQKKQKSPEDCFASTKEIYEQVKPFFEKYGYDIDNWNVTVDNDDLFSAETSSEGIVLQDSSLAINLNKGGHSRGLWVFADGNSINDIQLHFDGGEQDKAYELLDVIFDGAYVNDKKLSEYIESEYESHLNESNISQWSNGRINYMVIFSNDSTLITLQRN